MATRQSSSGRGYPGRSLLAAICCVQTGVALAGADQNFEDPVTDALAAPTPAAKKGNRVFVPIPVANPTVGTGLQLVALYLHPKKPGEEAAPSSTSGAGAMWTDSRSWLVGVFHDGSYAHDRYRLTAFAGFGQFNLNYYGVGDSATTEGQSIPYEFRGGAGQLRGEIRVPHTDHWFAGLTYLFVQSVITFRTADPAVQLPDFSGEFRSAALGPQVAYDSRNSTYYPTQGQYLRAGWQNYAPAWGGDFKYDKTDIFYNAYIPVAARTVLAVRTRLQTASGNTPFFDLPTLDMRGFSRDRYRDQRSLSLTAEGRHKLATRWGVVAFVEAGRVAPTLDALSSARTITSYGGGVRWQVTAERQMNIGLDYAHSTDDSAVFIQVGERF